VDFGEQTEHAALREAVTAVTRSLGPDYSIRRPNRSQPDEGVIRIPHPCTADAVYG
jgi:hypothetical protein